MFQFKKLVIKHNDKSNDIMACLITTPTRSAIKKLREKNKQPNKQKQKFQGKN